MKFVLSLIAVIFLSGLCTGCNIFAPEPETFAVEKTPASVKYVISIKKDGSIFYQKDKIESADLPATLKKEGVKKSEKIHIKADRDVKYSVVAQVMDLLLKAGYSKVYFSTKKK